MSQLHPPQSLLPPAQRAQQGLSRAIGRELLRAFPPVDFAFNYGSAAFLQTTMQQTTHHHDASGATTGTPSDTPFTLDAETTKMLESIDFHRGNKMYDMILAVETPLQWHDLNRTVFGNDAHYAGGGRNRNNLARWSATDTATMFIPNVPVKIRDKSLLDAGVPETINVKYGVSRLSSVVDDCINWTTLLVAGRMQKPVNVLQANPLVELASRLNLHHVAVYNLLRLPEAFTEMEFYRAVVSTSYMGDIRYMLRAEDPQKIDKIIMGALPFFRELYSDVLPTYISGVVHQPKTPLSIRRDLHPQQPHNALPSEATRLPLAQDFATIYAQIRDVDPNDVYFLQPSTLQHRAFLYASLPSQAYMKRSLSVAPYETPTEAQQKAKERRQTGTPAPSIGGVDASGGGDNNKQKKKQLAYHASLQQNLSALEFPACVSHLPYESGDFNFGPTVQDATMLQISPYGKYDPLAQMQEHQRELDAMLGKGTAAQGEVGRHHQQQQPQPQIEARSPRRMVPPHLRQSGRHQPAEQSQGPSPSSSSSSSSSQQPPPSPAPQVKKQPPTVRTLRLDDDDDDGSDGDDSDGGNDSDTTTTTTHSKAKQPMLKQTDATTTTTSTPQQLSNDGKASTAPISTIHSHTLHDVVKHTAATTATTTTTTSSSSAPTAGEGEGEGDKNENENTPPTTAQAMQTQHALLPSRWQSLYKTTISDALAIERRLPSPEQHRALLAGETPVDIDVPAPHPDTLVLPVVSPLDPRVALPTNTKVKLLQPDRTGQPVPASPPAVLATEIDTRGVHPAMVIAGSTVPILPPPTGGIPLRLPHGSQSSQQQHHPPQPGHKTTPAVFKPLNLAKLQPPSLAELDITPPSATSLEPFSLIKMKSEVFGVITTLPPSIRGQPLVNYSQVMEMKHGNLIQTKFRPNRSYQPFVNLVPTTPDYSLKHTKDQTPFLTMYQPTPQAALPQTAHLEQQRTAAHQHRKVDRETLQQDPWAYDRQDLPRLHEDAALSDQSGLPPQALHFRALSLEGRLPEGGCHPEVDRRQRWQVDRRLSPEQQILERARIGHNILPVDAMALTGPFTGVTPALYDARQWQYGVARFDNSIAMVQAILTARFPLFGATVVNPQRTTQSLWHHDLAQSTLGKAMIVDAVTTVTPPTQTPQDAHFQLTWEPLTNTNAIKLAKYYNMKNYEWLFIASEWEDMLADPLVWWMAPNYTVSTIWLQNRRVSFRTMMRGLRSGGVRRALKYAWQKVSKGWFSPASSPSNKGGSGAIADGHQHASTAAAARPAPSPTAAKMLHMQRNMNNTPPLIPSVTLEDSTPQTMVSPFHIYFRNGGHFRSLRQGAPPPHERVMAVQHQAQQVMETHQRAMAAGQHQTAQPGQASPLAQPPRRGDRHHPVPPQSTPTRPFGTSRSSHNNNNNRSGTGMSTIADRLQRENAQHQRATSGVAFQTKPTVGAHHQWRRAPPPSVMSRGSALQDTPPHILSGAHRHAAAAVAGRLAMGVSCASSAHDHSRRGDGKRSGLGPSSAARANHQRRRQRT